MQDGQLLHEANCWVAAAAATSHEPSIEEQHDALLAVKAENDNDADAQYLVRLRDGSEKFITSAYALAPGYTTLCIGGSFQRAEVVMTKGQHDRIQRTIKEWEEQG